MSDLSQPKDNLENEAPENEAQAIAEVPAAEGNKELSAEELDEMSGAGLILMTTGTTTSTVSTTPPPPPATVAQPILGPVS